MSEEQTPVETVPPASRLGEIVGWSLLALAVTCFIAFNVANKQADDWLQVMRQAAAAWNDANITYPDHVAAAREAYMAAEAVYKEARLLAYLSVCASFIFVLLIPGLLYAMKPSLLGGPLGRLLRPSSAKLVQRLPPRRHPVTFYQGIGVVLMSIPCAFINLGFAITPLILVV